MMKHILSLFLLFCFAIGFSQEKTVEGVKRLKVRSVGAFQDSNNEGIGYYMMYEKEKAQKGMRVYSLEILDRDFNTMATKNITLGKWVQLIEGVYNGEALGLCFFDPKENLITVKVYNREAKQIKSKKIPIEKKDAKMYRILETDEVAMYGSILTFDPVENAGFLLTRNKDYQGLLKNKYNSESIFIPSSENATGFKINAASDDEKRESINVLASNKNTIVVSKNTANSKKDHSSELMAFDTKTGKKLFSRDIEDPKKPQLISGAFFSKNGFIALTGEYFKAGVNPFTAKSEGLYFKGINLNGEETFYKELSWAGDIQKELGATQKSKIKEIGYLYFHDFVNVGDKYYMVTEAYKETVSAGKVAVNVISAIGGGGASTDNSQLTIMDGYVLKFNNKLELEDVIPVEKQTSRWQGAYTTASPQANAHLANMFGAFDYQYLQKDADTRAFINFVDYERRKGEKNGFTVKSMVLNQENSSEDKIDIDTKASWFKVFPSKIGEVAIVEYYRKEKALRFHREKFNVE